MHEGPAIEYRIKTSLRARNVRLTVSPRGGLTVVVPRNFDLRRIPALVKKKRDWIEMHLRRFANASETVVNGPAAALPETIDLRALGESWQIGYHLTNTPVIGALAESAGRLVVYGAVSDPDACRDALVRWLRLRTREELVPWLTRLAAENGFTFNEALVRGQKTRWASCSESGTISLSFRLLFLERDWVHCVLLHELCHTVCMNHSSEFWALLSRLEPECRAIDRRMRDSWKLVPHWAE
jgi:predicted metal-dependent hydrolase